MYPNGQILKIDLNLILVLVPVLVVPVVRWLEPVTRNRTTGSMRMQGQDTGRNVSRFDRAARNKIWDAATILPPTTASTIVLWFRTKMFTASESTGVPANSSNYCQTRYIELMKTLFRFDQYPVVGRTQYMSMTDIFMFWRACTGGLYVLFTLRSSVLITSIDQTLKKKWSDKVKKRVPVPVLKIWSSVPVL